MPLYIAFHVVGLSGFREITTFSYRDTFYYNLNPLTKMLFAFSSAISSSSGPWWISPFLVAGILASYISLEEGRRKFLIALYVAISLLWGSVWNFAIYIHRVPAAAGQVLWTWPLYFSYIGIAHVLLLQAMLTGTIIYVRLLPPIFASLIIIMTSKPSHIMDGMQLLRIPLMAILSILVGVETVPKIFQALNVNLKVRFMRGFGSGAPRSLYFIYTIAGIILAIIPAMISLFRGARNIAIATGTRAFGAYKTRSALKSVNFTAKDLLLVFVSALLIASPFLV